MTENARGEVQDNVRERTMAHIFKLRRTGKRTGPDAHDEFDRPWELKSTTTSSVGTGRDVGHRFLDEFCSRPLLAAKGTQGDFGFQPDEMYYVPVGELEPWADSIREKLDADESLIERAIAALGRDIDDAEAARLRYVGSRGATYNNPKIPWQYIRDHGVRLTGDSVDLVLRELVAAHEAGASLVELRLMAGDARDVVESEDAGLF